MKLSIIELKHLVREPYFSRGKEYYEQGLVELVTITNNSAKMRVAGNTIYSVNFSRKNGQLLAKCTCPAYTDFGPCKHLAASAFVLMNKATYAPSAEYDEVKEFADDIIELLSKKRKMSSSGSLSNSLALTTNSCTVLEI